MVYLTKVRLIGLEPIAVGTEIRNSIHIEL
jgi:hypothetical protein